MVKFLSKLLGNKADKDLKIITPFANDIKAMEGSIAELSNDQLRAKTYEFKERIKSYIENEESEIKHLKDSIEENPDLDIDEKESIYERIDLLEKESYSKTQDILNEILPEAFAVMKETAKRFMENEKIEVEATEMDREIAATRESINIKGNRAIYDNQWMAGGNLIQWNMVHLIF